MSDSKKNAIGSVMWTDLTIPNAEKVRDFYREVVGWQADGMDLKDENGGYEDYVMKDSNGTPIAGVCHKRGVNKDIPSSWIIYISVASIGQSIEKCRKLGGKVLKESKKEDGSYQYVLIEDPAGAVVALSQAES